MSDQVQVIPEVIESIVVAANPFDDEGWTPKPIDKLEESAKPEAPALVPVVEPIVANTDFNSIVKEKFGYDSLEIAEQEFKKLKELKPQEEVKFANTESESYYKALLAGDEDAVLNILSTKKKLERLSKADVNISTAEEIIKLGLSSKYKDLSPEEIDFEFKDQFSFPEKPKKTEDQEDDEYAEVLSKWEERVKSVQQKIIIEAKKFKPELDKLKTELVLHNIQKEVPANMEADQEVLERNKRIRETYETTLNSDYSKFNGFSVTVKNDDVEVQIPFVVTNEEKEQLKTDFMTLVPNDYFGQRWFDKDDKPKVQEMMADKYFLENREKIIQKAANEAVAQFKEKYIKARGNIEVVPKNEGTFTPDSVTDKEKEQVAIWEA